MNLQDYVESIEDFPSKGILFRDLTPLMQNGPTYKYALDQLIEYAKKLNVDVVIGPEARGFMFACPIAYAMNLGFVPVRKPGKLPRKSISYKYNLEYGSNELHINVDAIKPNQRVLIVDDLLATGGTTKACCNLVEQLGGIVAGCLFVIELADLKGRDVLSKYDVHSLIKY